MPADQPLIAKQPSSASKVKTATVLTNEDVLRSEVPWTSFATAGIITKEQCEMIYTLDDKSVAEQARLFHSKGAAFVSLFVDILTGINKVCALLSA